MKPVEDMNIRHFKLINGDNILALVHKKEQGRVIVERPVLVNETLIGGYTLRPWFAFSSQTMYTILDGDIMAHMHIDVDVKHTYVKAVTTEQSLPNIMTEETLSDEYEQLLNEGTDPDSTKKVVH